MDTPAHLTLSPAQAVTSDLRVRLRQLGAADQLAARIVPRSDIEGRPYVYIPALPLGLAERVLAILTADAEATS